MALFINAVFFVLLTGRPTSSRRLQDRNKVSLQKDSAPGDLETISLQMMDQPETLEDFQELLLKAKDKTVIVDFTATWCGPCQRIKPFFADLENNFPHVVFCKIDVDENAKTAEKYGVKAMPTFMAFRGGEKDGEMSGADANTLQKFVEKYQFSKWGEGQTLGTVSASENGEATSGVISKSGESQSASQSASASAASERDKRMAALAKRGLK